ncbi:MAG TPA: hypothetical protein VGD17_07790 [Chitinophagaceae bacterium]
MMKPLRKKHLFIWIGLAAIMPAGIISAWMARPEKIISEPIEKNNSISFTKVVKEVKTEKYSIRLLCNSDNSSCQLQYNSLVPQDLPSALLYRMMPGATGINGNELLGRIGERRTYQFDIPVAGRKSMEQQAFILYDFIHQQIIDTIKF